MELVLLVGPMGTGKSTICKNSFPNHTRISQDDQGKIGHWNIFLSALNNNEDIIIDRCNFSREQRQRYIEPAKKLNYKTKIIVVHHSYRTCLKRLLKRTNHPNLNGDNPELCKKVLSSYFKDYERVQNEEADIVDKSPADPFMHDLSALSKRRKKIIIGDVHGCFDELIELLFKVDYKLGKDLVIFTGDLIDKGPNNKAVMDFVMNTPLVFSVIGNHENKFLRWLRGNSIKFTEGFGGAKKELGASDDLRYYLEDLPYLIKLNDHTYICHGGINPQKHIERQRKDALIYTRTFNPITFSYTDPIAKPFYSFKPIDTDLKLFFGHAVTDKIHVSNWAKSLDGGCVHGGTLRACVIYPNSYEEYIEVKAKKVYMEHIDTEFEYHPSLKPYEDRVALGLLRKSENGDLVLYKYTEQCTFTKTWDEFTRKARGIIFNKITGKLIARPFEKFFNLNEMPESLVEYLPTCNYKCYDKVDGSLGISYFNEALNKWCIATCGSFSSAQALKATEMLNKHNTALLNKNWTYLFEIVYPENKIVCDYGDREELVLLAVMDTNSTIELRRSQVETIAEILDFSIVEEYNYSIDKMIKMQKTLSKDQEGFVVRFDNGLRVKIKGEEYLKIHKIRSGITPLNIWNEMRKGKLPISYKVIIPEELIKEVEAIELVLYEQYKQVGLEIEEDIKKWFAFLNERLRPIVDETDKKMIGLIIKDKGSEMKHPSAIFPFFLKNDDVLEKYIMKQIKPKANIYKEW